MSARSGETGIPPLRLSLIGVALGVGTLFACSGTVRAFPDPIPVLLRSGLCDTILNTERCARAIEEHQLDQTSRVLRTQRGLCFDGLRSCVTRDTTTEFGDESRYYLGTLDDPSFHVLWAQYTEGSAILLVHPSTGRRLWSDGIPVPSPSGELVAVASADLIAGYNPNRLTILRARGDSLVELWSVEPEDWGPAGVRWISDARLLVETVALDTAGHTETEGDSLVVERADGHWQMGRDER